MRRFVVLLHDWPFLHWDLLLEQEGKLLAWRILSEPAPGRSCEVEALADHRIVYLDYTGPISGNRGAVERWDDGELLELAHQAEGLDATLDSRKFGGRLPLHIRNDQIVFGCVDCS